MSMPSPRPPQRAESDRCLAASSAPDRHETPSPGALPMAPAGPGRCCGLGKIAAVAGAVTLATVAVAAAFLAGRASGRAEQQAAWASRLPEIDATGAVSSEQFSLATGLVTDEAEGMFVLDHNSGLLQCSVIYPRAGRFMAKFTANVGEALATGGKGGQYIMTVGRVDFPRASNRPVGSSVVYVLDTATGSYACYGIPFDHSALNTGRPQQGTLPLLATGTANPILDRDRLR